MVNNIQFGEKAVFRRPEQVKVCFQLVQNRAGDPSLNIDMAPNKSNDTSWQGKATFQLTIDEISLFAAYFLRFTNELNFAFHGENNNKSVTVKRKQHLKGDKRIYHQLSMWEGGQGLFYINLSHFEGFRVFNLLLTQLQNYYGQSKNEVISLLTAYYNENI